MSVRSIRGLGHIACMAALAWALAGCAGRVASDPRVAIFCYHDVTRDAEAPRLSVSPELLRTHLRALRAAGWEFVALSRLVAAARDSLSWTALPARTAVLTIDDGYRSGLTEVLPLLEAERVPATFAIVPAFLDAPPADLPPLLSWDELRTLARSPWVDVIAHSNDLHRYVTCDPYRDTWPAVTTRAYRLGEARYETRDEYRERVREDLVRVRARLRDELGEDVAVLAWPYGEHNDAARALAAEAGFALTLALDERLVARDDVRRGLVSRYLVGRDTPLDGAEAAWQSPPHRPLRPIEVALDTLYDSDPRTLEQRLQALEARAQTQGAPQVLIDPFVGVAPAAWFHNHQLPVRADIAGYVAHRLIHAGCRIWWRVPARQRIGGAGVDLLADLAVYLPVDGILFDDAAPTPADAIADRERAAHQEALQAAVRAWRPHARFARRAGESLIELARAAPVP